METKMNNKYDLWEQFKPMILESAEAYYSMMHSSLTKERNQKTLMNVLNYEREFLWKAIETMNDCSDIQCIEIVQDLLEWNKNVKRGEVYEDFIKSLSGGVPEHEENK